MFTNRYRVVALVFVAVLAVVGGLALALRPPNWQTPLEVDGAPSEALTAADWREAAQDFPGLLCDGEWLPLERLLGDAGVDSVETVSVDGQEYAWSDVYEDAWVARDGRLAIGDGTAASGAAIAVQRPPEANQVAASLTDLAPTIAGALGLPSPAETTGRALGQFSTDRAVLVILDGLGYREYMAHRGTEVTPFLDSLAAPRLGSSVYPSVTMVSTAAMLAGATPDRTGVRDRSTRDIAAETILQVVTEADRRAVVVEGNALPVNMPAADLRLSGDRDGNGFTDDNTRDNALAVLAEGAPDFLLVHFHGIDDMGHSYGPGSEQVLERMAAVDGYLEEVVVALPADTLVLIVADHGMHAITGDDSLGNHGSLHGDDMFVPIWVLTL